MNEPQMPSVVLVPTRKQMPLHCTLRGFISPGTITRIDGLHADPSASLVRSAPVVPQLPVRTLQTEPRGQSVSREQNEKHPGASGVPPECVYHHPVHTKPALHDPEAPMVAVGLHAWAQSELSAGLSPCVRQVDPVPPQSARSVAWDALLAHPPEQNGVDPPGKHPRSAPHAGSSPPMGSGIVHAAPAREPVLVVVHRPNEQLCPTAHRTPHTPQLVVSVEVSTHAAPHIVRGVAHAGAPKQSPILHVCPGMHRMPQKPQLLTSEVTSIQPSEQGIRGAVHVGAAVVQMPSTQFCIERHARPHDPQLRVSELTSMHEPPHVMRGAAHVGIGDVHAPLMQLWPDGHMRPHAPQLLLSLSVSTHAVPQRARGAEHVGVVIMHVPLEHLCPDKHTRPQEPQLLESASTSTHAPLQVMRGGAHITFTSAMSTTSLPASSSGRGRPGPCEEQALATRKQRASQTGDAFISPTVDGLTAASRERQQSSHSNFCAAGYFGNTRMKLKKNENSTGFFPLISTVLDHLDQGNSSGDELSAGCT
jgi:hypothetical protein